MNIQAYKLYWIEKMYMILNLVHYSNILYMNALLAYTLTNCNRICWAGSLTRHCELAVCISSTVNSIPGSDSICFPTAFPLEMPSPLNNYETCMNLWKLQHHFSEMCWLGKDRQSQWLVLLRMDSWILHLMLVKTPVFQSFTSVLLAPDHFGLTFAQTNLLKLVTVLLKVSEYCHPLYLFFL